MLLQPRFHRRNLPVSQQINGVVALQITDQRPVAQSALVCPVIQSNDSRFRCGWLLRAANQTQDGIATPTDAQLASHIGSRLTSDSEAKLTQRFLQSNGALGMRMTKLGKPFDEHLLCTSALFTEKAAQVNDEMDRTTSRWKIVERSVISALHPRGTRLARGTRGCWRRCTQRERNLISHINTLNEQIGKVGKEYHRKK